MKRCILIVDDEENMLYSLNRLLRKRYEVVSSRSAKEAISRMKEQQIDLVITDLMMPEMNGIELVRHIREMNPEIGIIMITGYGDIDSYLEVMSFGAFEYITKPYNDETLLSVIEKIIPH